MYKSRLSRIGQGLAAVMIVAGVAIAWMSVTQSGATRSVASAPGPAAMTDAGINRAPAPDFALPALNGDIVRLSESSGNVRIVDFWATWCPPCIKEIPHFQKLHETYGDKGLTMIGVSLDEKGAEVVRPFVSKHGMTYATVVGDAETARAFGGIEAIPTTFVIDRQGRIYRKYVGYRDYETFEQDVKTLMAE